MAEVVIAVIAVVGGIVAIAVILAWLKGYDEGYEDGCAQQKMNQLWMPNLERKDNEKTNSND